MVYNYFGKYHLYWIYCQSSRNHRNWTSCPSIFSIGHLFLNKNKLMLKPVIQKCICNLLGEFLTLICKVTSPTQWLMNQELACLSGWLHQFLIQVRAVYPWVSFQWIWAQKVSALGRAFHCKVFVYFKTAVFEVEIVRWENHWGLKPEITHTSQFNNHTCHS